MAAFVLIKISGTDPEKEFSLKFFANKTIEDVLKVLAKDFIDQFPIEEAVGSAKEAEAFETFLKDLGEGNADPMSLYRLFEYPLPVSRHTDNFNMSCLDLMLVEPFSSYDYHYYIGSLHADTNLQSLKYCFSD